MFDRLQHKWKVSGLQVILILCTFAIGGSLTGYAGKLIMNFLSIDTRALWIVIYIIVVTLIWPISVLLISIPFGQYRFFTGYLKKMGQRLRLIRNQSNQEPQTSSSALPRTNLKPPLRLRSGSTSNPLVRIAIFASGAGSNAQKIIDHFRKSNHIGVALIVCNKPDAGVMAIARFENIPAVLIEKERFFRGDAYLPELQDHKIDFIVLAGFLWKVPDALVNAFPNGIVNIHPALLPKFGGKGMYGDRVHAAVIASGEKESGITIHYVDGHYDNGDIIFQAKCPVEPDDSPESLAQRIHALEHAHYPTVIEHLLLRN